MKMPRQVLYDQYRHIFMRDHAGWHPLEQRTQKYYHGAYSAVVLYFLKSFLLKNYS